MQAAELEPFARAIHEQICANCQMMLPDGTCIQPKERQCSLAIHLGAVVESVLGTPEGGGADDYRKAFAEHMCDVCPQDETGYCSLLELIGSATDHYVERLAYVVRGVAKA